MFYSLFGGLLKAFLGRAHEDRGLLTICVCIDGKDGEWFLISLSDNDFITQDGKSALLCPLLFSAHLLQNLLLG